jgi:hypothetical protein
MCLLIGLQQQQQHVGGSDQSPSTALPHQMSVIKREPTGKLSVCSSSEAIILFQCLLYSLLFL